MDANKLITELSRHPVIKNDMDIEMQLGLPFLEKKSEKLFVSFKPHKEFFRDGSMEYYEPVYEVSWLYPSERLVYFRDLYYEDGKDFRKPLHTISEKQLLSKGKYLFEEIYRECSRCLDLWDRDGVISDITIKKYNAILEETISLFGLDSIYFRCKSEDR